VARNRPALLLTVLWLAACSNGMQARSTEGSGAAQGSGSTTTGPAGAPASNTKGTAQVASPEQDIAVAQHAIAQDLRVDDSAVTVRPLHVTVPGITVFSASAKAGRHVTRTGIVAGGAIYSETDAMSRVARAWGYGVKRTVPAVTVAQVFGALHSATAESSPFLDEDTVDTYQKVAGPRRAAAVALPVETTVDGLPAVVYCLTSSARATPFSVVTAIVKPDFQVELRAQPVLED
jgi:hypothetical protein